MTWAVVTGASGGLGQAFAEYLAAQGKDVVLVARNQHAMVELGTRLSGRYGVRTLVKPVDLTDRDARSQLVDELLGEGLEVSVLVNNAGFGTYGPVADEDPDRIADEIDLNCAALVHLTRLLLPAMLERHQGSIINVASTAAYQPIPHMAVYAASKAFVLSFSQALWEETDGTGVRVVGLCPGPTDTAFFAIAGNDEAMVSRRTPQQVVATAFAALERHQPSVTDGTFNAVQGHLAAVLPRRLVTKVARLTVTPRKGRTQH